jgi:hypothetical protein
VLVVVLASVRRARLTHEVAGASSRRRRAADSVLAAADRRLSLRSLSLYGSSWV